MFDSTGRVGAEGASRGPAHSRHQILMSSESTTVGQYLHRLRRDAAAMARKFRTIHPDRQAELRPEIERTLAEIQRTIGAALK